MKLNNLGPGRCLLEGFDLQFFYELLKPIFRQQLKQQSFSLAATYFSLIYEGEKHTWTIRFLHVMCTTLHTINSLHCPIFLCGFFAVLHF